MAINDDEVEWGEGLRRNRIEGFDDQLLVIVEGNDHGNGGLAAFSALEDHIRRKDLRGAPGTPR